MAKKPTFSTTEILEYIKNNPLCSSIEILSGISQEMSIATLKRVLQDLISSSLVNKLGELKNRRYEISPVYEIIRPIDVNQYFEKEIDERIIQDRFNHELMSKNLRTISLFTDNENDYLIALQAQFKSNSSKLSSSEYKIELERLAIDLSWKSSGVGSNFVLIPNSSSVLIDGAFSYSSYAADSIIMLD